MSWQSLLAERRVHLHLTSRQELDDLRDVVARDLQDARVPGLAADRFATAYNAVLQIGKMVIACAGCRAGGVGHHQTTLEAIELAMGPGLAKLAAYFGTCRRKRNIVDYDMAHVASKMEADELIRQADGFRQLAEDWIAANYPHLAIGAP